MTARTVPVAVSEVTFTLLGVALRCSVLDNGMRLIDATDWQAFLRALDGGELVLSDEVAAFQRWMEGR